MKILGLIACLALVPAAFAKPQDVRLRFGMTFAGIPIAEVVDTLTFSEDGYRIESLATAIGVAEMIGIPSLNRFSTGKVDADGNLLMEDFRDERGEKVRKVTMDHATGEVSWLSDKGESGKGFGEGQQVYNSLTVAYTPYATGALPSDGAALLTTGRRFYSFSYSTEKLEEKIMVDAGEFEVWRQDRLDDSGSRKHSIWFAPELDNLPVKMSIGGVAGTIEIELIKASFSPAKD